MIWHVGNPLFVSPSVVLNPRGLVSLLLMLLVELLNCLTLGFFLLSMLHFHIVIVLGLLGDSLSDVVLSLLFFLDLLHCLLQLNFLFVLLLFFNLVKMLALGFSFDLLVVVWKWLNDLVDVSGNLLDLFFLLSIGLNDKLGVLLLLSDGSFLLSFGFELLFDFSLVSLNLLVRSSQLFLVFFVFWILLDLSLELLLLLPVDLSVSSLVKVVHSMLESLSLLLLRWLLDDIVQNIVGFLDFLLSLSFVGDVQLFHDDINWLSSRLGNRGIISSLLFNLLSHGSVGWLLNMSWTSGSLWLWSSGRSSSGGTSIISKAHDIGVVMTMLMMLFDGNSIDMSEQSSYDEELREFHCKYIIILIILTIFKVSGFWGFGGDGSARWGRTR